MDLRITPLGRVDPAVLQLLVDGLPGHLPVQPAVVKAADPALPDGPIPSATLVDALLRGAQARPLLLGVTERPLLSADGQPIFGEATMGGPVAVISLAALREPPDERLPRRVLVSALHELGHMAGAEHCPDPRCVMYPSRAVAETDVKGPAACPGCAALIRTFFAGSA